jgi:nicotinamidase-related amidase
MNYAAINKSNHIDAENTTLILIDLQGRLMPAIEQGEKILQQCIRTAQIAQLLEIPIVGTEQSPLSLGGNIEAIKPYCSKTIVKNYFNACADGLVEAIPSKRKQCILMGCETHVCVMQTALNLIDEGYDVSIVVDGVGSRRALDKQIALDRLQIAGARLITAEMLGFEWLKTAQNAAFKKALALLKQ